VLHALLYMMVMLVRAEG